MIYEQIYNFKLYNIYIYVKASEDFVSKQKFFILKNSVMLYVCKNLIHASATSLLLLVMTAQVNFETLYKQDIEIYTTVKEIPSLFLEILAACRFLLAKTATFHSHRNRPAEKYIILKFMKLF